MNTISLQYHLDGIPKILRLKMIKCILITTNTILEILRVWKMTSNTQWAKIQKIVQIKNSKNPKWIDFERAYPKG